MVSNALSPRVVGFVSFLYASSGASSESEDEKLWYDLELEFEDSATSVSSPMSETMAMNPSIPYWVSCVMGGAEVFFAGWLMRKRLLLP